MSGAPETKQIRERGMPVGTLRERLLKLAEERGKNDLMGEFASLVASHFVEHAHAIEPSEFVYACHSVIDAIEDGRDDEYTEIQSPLVGLPPAAYEAFRMLIPDLAECVCPQEFHLHVGAEFKRIRSDAARALARPNLPPR